MGCHAGAGRMRSARAPGSPSPLPRHSSAGRAPISGRGSVWMLTLQRGWDNAAHTLLVCWVTAERGFPRKTS